MEIQACASSAIVQPWPTECILVEAPVACGCDEAPVTLEETLAFERTEADLIVAETVIQLAEPVPASAPPDESAVPPASSVVIPSTPEATAAEPVPDDVQQASAAEPDIALEPVPTPAPAQEAVVAAPALESEENLFTLADAARAEDTAAGRADEPTTDRAPADGAGVSEEGVEDSDEGQPEPANPLDAAERRSGEPVRLWIDATGRHSVVGVLIGVRGDGTCILDTGSEMVQIPAAALRRRDRDYAEQAAARLAAGLRPVVSR